MSDFLIYRASAGSGKTFTLVKHYLELAFAVPDNELSTRFRSILAITFTNKAANEMKERILRELDNMVMGYESEMAKQIVSELSYTEDILKQKASAVRTAILHNYSDLSVCTIDSFMHRIVRTFAHDLHLPVNFNVQIESTDLIQNAVDELMASVGLQGEESLTEILCAFSENNMEDGKSYNIERNVKELASRIFEEDTPLYLQKLGKIDFAQFLEINKILRATNADFEREIVAVAQQALDVCKTNNLIAEDFPYKGGGTYSVFSNLANRDFLELDKPHSRIEKYIADRSVVIKSTPPETAKRLDTITPQLIMCYKSIQDKLEKGYGNYNTRRLLLQHLFELALLNRLQQNISQYSAENEIVHISEFKKSIYEVVSKEYIPFVYERIGSRYNNFMIDEFQDTSKMQWANLLPLLEDGVGAKKLSLVVGDGKQAIYRFRQGDVHQFINLPHVESELHHNAFENSSHYVKSEVINLKENYRTVDSIVNFNNNFFKWLIDNCYKENEALKQIYADVEQTPVKKGGYVEIGFSEELEQLYGHVYETVASLVTQQGYQYRDILILTSRNNQLTAVSQYLAQKQIDGKTIEMVSSESFLLRNSNAVMLLRALLQYIIDPTDRLAMALILIRMRALGRIDNELETMFLNGKSNDLSQLLNDNGIYFKVNQYASMPLIDCCEQGVRVFNLGDIEPTYVAAFLNVVANYGKLHRQDISEFLEWFDEQLPKLSASTANDLDAIRLMTIHKAKGLESPVVIYIVPTESSHSVNIWVDVEDVNMQLPIGLISPGDKVHSQFDKQYKEELSDVEMDNINRLYVALTRPQERLYVYCQQKSKKSNKQEEPLRNVAAQLSAYISTNMNQFAEVPNAIDIKKDIDQQEGEINRTVEVHAPATITCYALNIENRMSSKINPTKSKSSSVSLPNITFSDWHQRLRIANHSHFYRTSITGNTNRNTSAISRGLMMHEVLSYVYHVGDEDAAVATYATIHNLNIEEQQTLLSQVEEVVKNKQVSRFFNPEYEVKTECELVLNGVLKRPDRVISTPTETWVVDFKTGRPNKEQKTYYQRQVEDYCQAIATIENHKVRGFLLYIVEEPRLEECCILN